MPGHSPGIWDASDKSGAITLGGTAQTIFVPQNGYGIYNPDPTNDLWICEGGAAAAVNGQGSIRVVANGGGYETPPTAKAFGPVSIIGVVTGQKYTARVW